MCSTNGPYMIAHRKIRADTGAGEPSYLPTASRRIALPGEAAVQISNDATSMTAAHDEIVSSFSHSSRVNVKPIESVPNHNAAVMTTAHTRSRTAAAQRIQNPTRSGASIGARNCNLSQGVNAVQTTHVFC